MVTDKKSVSKRKSNGMFLFFLSGLLLLQVTFSYTIHGDIGPQAALNTSCRTPASPLLMGRIDTILSAPNQSEHKASRTAPMALEAPSPVSRFSLKNHVTDSMASMQSNASGKSGDQKSSSRNQDGRFIKYTVTSGDTLESISRKLCGRTTMVGALIRLNRLSDEKALQCGAQLLIPRTLMAKK